MADKLEGGLLTGIILVRHGRTEWNRVERFRGRADLDLDEVGVRQAELTSERLAQWPVSVIYSSPLRRAMRTAHILSRRLSLEAKPLDGLIDIDYGNWQGLSPEEAALRDQEVYSQWIERPHLVTFPGGEGLARVRERVASVIEEVLKLHPDEVIALVSHLVVCKVFVLSLLGLDDSHFWRVEQGVCAINLFQVGNEIPTVTLLNDTCHLKDPCL
jgi:probable phosphoglycerate mutase